MGCVQFDPDALRGGTLEPPPRVGRRMLSLTVHKGTAIALCYYSLKTAIIITSYVRTEDSALSYVSSV